MVEKINEADIIEQLNVAPSVRGFFIAAVNIFEKSIDSLVQRIFRSDYLAVKAVINPLLESSGPLGDLSVRIKLLFGLGVIPDDVYHDIETIIRLRNQLNKDGAEYRFTDPNILDSIHKISAFKKMGIFQLAPALIDDKEIDATLYQLQLDRQQQVIKSSLSLAIVEICNKLNVESPFTT
ncbi:MltR family transcriptional regulator [Vibrio gazogenes]|uniref:Mannitol operon repressor n=1 Tax=Vibrio gazogenes DSM 21264 = NBRC 103151 TaxID=1123492 RepID=A0A1M4SEA4_VIBGA|nr:MltR family transcriptional regulator [Vibrio gazogenes]USP15848.1 MltR family transcriptional regulator [Vibrio gazogenes]SHE30563.1 mannitol operon repressor [Vibrio gazogenes DSM 21264] [Vibrio gazogenes DSM 21264 = NBRC 103151]SJN59026.1 Mannitol operon repressor [Vibrio gazogenes]